MPDIEAGQRNLPDTLQVKMGIEPIRIMLFLCISSLHLSAVSVAAGIYKAPGNYQMEKYKFYFENRKKLLNICGIANWWQRSLTFSECENEKHFLPLYIFDPDCKQTGKIQLSLL